MFWYLILGIWHLCCRFLLTWVLKPVTGSPRDSAFSIGYSPAGYESLGDSFYQRKTQQDPVGALMDAKVSPFVSPSVSLPSFAACNLPDSSLSLSQFYHSLSLTACTPSLLLLLWSISKGPDCSLEHMQRGDTDACGCVCMCESACACWGSLQRVQDQRERWEESRITAMRSRRRRIKWVN